MIVSTFGPESPTKCSGRYAMTNWNASGTRCFLYVQLLYINRVRWWRRGESKACGVLCARKLLILRSHGKPQSALIPVKWARIGHVRIAPKKPKKTPPKKSCQAVAHARARVRGQPLLNGV